MPSWSSSFWRHWLTATCQRLTRSEGRSSCGHPPPPIPPPARASSASLPTSTYQTPWPHWPPRSTHQVWTHMQLDIWISFGLHLSTLGCFNWSILSPSIGENSHSCWGEMTWEILIKIRLWGWYREIFLIMMVMTRQLFVEKISPVHENTHTWPILCPSTKLGETQPDRFWVIEPTDKQSEPIT